MLAEMADSVAEALAKLVEGGRADQVGEHHFVSLIELDSGKRYGLVPASETVCWAVLNGGVLTLFSSATVTHFVALLQHDRAWVDNSIEAACPDLGLPPLDTLFSFPLFEMVRHVLRTSSQHLIKLALLWLRPTELRELRDELHALTQREELPETVRQLAERLVVAQ